MFDQNIILNTCYQFITSQSNIVLIAKYSHIIPIILSLILSIFVFIKAKGNLFSRIFLFFVITFAVWLIGNLITWVLTDYNLIYTVWSFLDLVEIVFYTLGLYFVLVFTNQKDISVFKKILLILLVLPAFIIVLTKKSVLGFNQSLCEANGNNFLTTYKLIVDGILLLIMLSYIIVVPFVKKFPSKKKKTNLIMIGSMFLFLLIFGVTEYLASSTGYYEINLYSLFLLPLLIVVIIYAVFELDIFNFNILGTQYLVVGLVILVVGQLFFVNGTTDQLLTILTVVVTVGLSILLYRNLKKESDQRIRIEDLSTQLENYNQKLKVANEKLKGLDKLKTEFVSLASHQLRSPLTAIKGYTSMLLEGDYGDIDPKAKETIERVMESSNNLTIVVEDLLNVTKIEAGGMKYEMAPFNLSEVAESVFKDLSITAEKKGLKFTFEQNEKEGCVVNGDKDKLRQVILNFIDNSLKYTKNGEIKIKVEKTGEKVVFSVKDTGMGMTEEIKETLFQKFARGEGARMNTTGSGLGLYLAKQIVEAHKGRVWVESEGEGKGSTFFVELDAVK